MAQSGMQEANGHRDPESMSSPGTNLYRSRFRALVQDLGPIWFTWCMNSGILGILYHQYNYQFPGLHVLSTIAFMIDFVLFIILSLLFILHFAWFRKGAWLELVGNPKDLALLACWPIAWMTVTSFVSLVVSGAYWGGYSFTVVTYVMWWIGFVWILGTLLFVFINLINHHNVADRDLPPAVVVPAVGVATLAVVGGLVSSFSTGISPHLAVPIIIASFCCVGIGLFMATFLYTYLFHQLLASGWPNAENAPNLFMFVGPMGQSAAALQVLGSSARTYGNFAGYNRGTFLTAAAAPALDTACVLLGLIVFLTLMYFVNLAFTIFRIAKGQLLIVKEDPRVKQQKD